MRLVVKDALHMNMTQTYIKNNILGSYFFM